MTYHLTVKNKSNKVTIATWIGDPQACTALAEDVFRGHGFAFGEVSCNDPTKQKIWKGYAPGCKHLFDTLEDAQQFGWNRRCANYVNMKGTSEACRYLLDFYQDSPADVAMIRKFFNL